MKVKKAKTRKNVLDSYNKRKTKDNVENTLLKSAVDTTAASIVGTSIAAIAGSNAPLVGVLMIAAGHYLGDESGVLRVAGASTIAYGIAKAKQYKENPHLAGVTERLKDTKSDFLIAFHIDWSEPKKKTDKSSSNNDSSENKKPNAIKEKETNNEDDADIGSLDVFEEKIETLAEDFHNEQEKEDTDCFFDHLPDLSLL